jgi:hypothetical protein
MSEIMMGVLRMPDDLFWSEDPITRAQHNSIRKEAADALAAAEARIAEMESQVLLPGVMRCAKCDLRLLRTNLNLASGTATAGHSKTGPCPNGCRPLWPVTEREERKELQVLVDKYHDRIAELEKSSFTQEELNIIRQWHNAVQDRSPDYLNADGFDDQRVFRKVSALLEPK